MKKDARGTVVRIYEGHSFKLTPDQIASISDAMAEIAEVADKPHDERKALLAQVWETEEGVFCCCHAVQAERALIINKVLNSRDLIAVQIDGKP